MDKEMKQLMDEIDRYIDAGIAKIDQQAALIRELVGALEALNIRCDPDGNYFSNWNANAADKVITVLSRVPEEYK